MGYPNFRPNSIEESDVVDAIAERACAMAREIGFEYSVSFACMDILACHLNGCPIKLEELRDADDANFAHDVFGIRRHLDRKTGELRDCFCPRYAA